VLQLGTDVCRRALGEIRRLHQRGPNMGLAGHEIGTEACTLQAVHRLEAMLGATSVDDDPRNGVVVFRCFYDIKHGSGSFRGGFSARNTSSGGWVVDSDPLAALLREPLGRESGDGTRPSG